MITLTTGIIVCKRIVLYLTKWTLSSYLDINWIYFVISNNNIHSSPLHCVWAANFTVLVSCPVSVDLLQLHEHLRCCLIPIGVLFFHFCSPWKNKKDYFLTVQLQFSSWVNFRCFFRWKYQSMAFMQRVKGDVMPVLCLQLFPMLLWSWAFGTNVGQPLSQSS